MLRVRFLALSCPILLVVKSSVVDCSDVGSTFLTLAPLLLPIKFVSVFIGHDGPECSNVSTVELQERGCDETQQCTPFMHCLVS
ncbi:hypothetical protein PF008_g6541 [Phytophthora fragariae]|uniref:Secreted protein n=1 Tax=Phytophthora fragariae TaxID=53985 RepID=A0A6G0S5B4_9STRA|nr:hypothetical protein PF008_g6541 [Phytophthora fragariae]